MAKEILYMESLIFIQLLFVLYREAINRSSEAQIIKILAYGDWIVASTVQINNPG